MQQPSSFRRARSMRTHSCRRRMARDAEAFSGIRYSAATGFQDRKIPVEEISDKNIFAIRREDRRFRQAANLYILRLRHFLAVDAQNAHASIFVVEKGLLVRIGASENNRHGNVPLRAHGETFRAISDNDAVDEP